MRLGRRSFLVRGAALATGIAATPALAAHGPHLDDDVKGVLVDLTECIGCRLCEYACKKADGQDAGRVESYDDQSVFREKRRPSPTSLTVLNSWQPDAGKPVYAKINCLHCNHPACASACIVGAITKTPQGPVVYDAWKCIGCRYCMVACPFQIPTYEYDDPLTPRVRKCEFCADRQEQGEPPACVKECPRQVMTFGRRSQLIELAHEKIKKHPDRYINHIYGEHEVGGTSWMYLSKVPFAQAGFLNLGQAAPPVLTEAIQHGVFKYWIAPIGWYGFLSLSYWWTKRKAHAKKAASHHRCTGFQPVAENAAAGEHVSSDYAPAHGLEARATGSAADGGVMNDGAADHQVARATSPCLSADEQKTWAGSPCHSVSEPLVEKAAAGEHLSSDHAPGHGLEVRATVEDHAHHDEHDHAAPVEAKLLTPGVWALIAVCAVGAGALIYRFIFGLAASTNLSQQYPWGLWIAMDVGSGIALAGGGFVTAAVVHVFHREHYHAVARSALLTALLGYTFYVPGLLADIGRWYNIWHPTIPTMWQGNSVLFEVGLCVMIYLNVQYAEIAPIVLKQFALKQGGRFPKLVKLLQPMHKSLEFVMPALLILGVALSTFHQSSLGNLMVIAPYKLHHLWWSPWSPLFFLLSAAMVGFPMVIFTILYASWSIKREPEMHVLAPLSRYVPVFMALYLISKVADIIWRGTWSYLLSPSLESSMWIAEMAMLIVPFVMLLDAKVRQSPKWLGTACLLIILAVVLNRLNVLIIGYTPPFATKSYFPSVIEFALSAGLVAALLLVYRVAITYLPILDKRPRREH